MDIYVIFLTRSIFIFLLFKKAIQFGAKTMAFNVNDQSHDVNFKPREELMNKHTI